MSGSGNEVVGGGAVPCGPADAPRRERDRGQILTLSREGTVPCGDSPRDRAGPDPSATRLVAGVDEAGRGPLAGPVVAAAVILDPARPVAGIGDSKALSAAVRARLAPLIRRQSIAWGIGMADAEEVDALNVLGATWLAMRRALLSLAVVPSLVRVDGNRCPSLASLGFECVGQSEVRGDSRFPEIGAASILAKTARDAWMVRAAQVYPGYGFEVHKGYPTAKHVQALASLGPCRLHRRSFSPLKSG